MTKRDAQRDATRQRLVDAAVESLIEVGYAASSTLEVQRRAGVSRGALLHHFPTREELFGAAIGQLVERNEQAVRRELASAPAGKDPLSRAMRVLRAALVTPAFGAELELWAAARTSKELRAVLRRAEGAARRDLYRVIGDVLGPEVTASPGYPLVADLTVQLLRGMAISDALYREVADREPLLERWAAVARLILDTPRKESDE
ncbi:TetR/AcrR family transcriptional regulator [Streptomyces sp. A3M-1-3]|uniref:TetR/AcrR family transcriptional regulator n=1 Tax=Streptomyces sp. A3M-1-3 TaxID=2962044 RepID=UPI0020B8B625|nr:TetR/AcrR family transcriptional regulator [Streptomyces sp. A3M-1-3]MCP3822653.1 TetR/AcrR family transcriptional regulator [Streptomyces sp. A3M-1-3]